MNYIKITPLDVANGPGCRVVLWTAGCSHHCKGCQAVHTWSHSGGELYNVEDIIKAALKALI